MIQLRRACFVLAALALCLGATPPIAQASPLLHSEDVKPDTSWMRLDSLAPATIPTKGTIVLTGTLHNGSGQTWHHLTVVPQISYYPLNSTSDIQAAASAADPDTVRWGAQLTTLAETLPDLASGTSTRFTLEVPRTKLSILGSAGVYWIGALPLSDEQHPSDLAARAFFPLLPKVNKSAHVNVALVVPLRGTPLRTSTGALAVPSGFTTLVSPRGRLGRIAAFGQTAGTRALTWMVDPALLDLADDQAAGVTAYAVGPAGSPLPKVATPTPSSSGSPNSSATPSGVPSGSPGASPTPGAALTPTEAARLTTHEWSASINALLHAPAAVTYDLPYGDPDVGTLVSTGHDDLLTTATTQSSQSMAARDVPGSPAVAPADGSLSQSVWSTLPVGQAAFVNGSSASEAQSVTAADGRLLVVGSATSAGGPGPMDQLSALNLRQRILADASLYAGSATTATLSVVLPAGWDPGGGPGIGSFFAPLTRSWISFTGLPDATAGTATLTGASTPATPSERANIAAALGLRSSVSRLAEVLATPSQATKTLSRQLVATEMTTMSSAAAGSVGYRSNAFATAAGLDRLIDDIQVVGTPFVTLSGSSGVITVALDNGLNVPISVGLRQEITGRGTTVTVDRVTPVTLDPGERSTLRLHVSAPRVSVQEVTLTAVTASGMTVGTPLTFTLRSSPIGAVVWAVLFAIGLVFVVLIARRISRRVSARRRTS